jgi:anti-anti-sigma factor
MSSENRVEVDRLADSIWVVSAIGEHDLATAPQLDQALTEIEKTGTTAVLDLTPATFIDSTVINTAIRHAQDHEGETNDWLLVVAPQGSAPRHVLDIIEVWKFFELFESRDDALGAAAARERGELSA